MFFILFIFAFIGVCIAGSKALKGLREENPEKAKTWGYITAGIILLVSGLRIVYRWMFPDTDDEKKSKSSFYILTEDYIFYEGTMPKVYFKKGDVVSGYVIKTESKTGSTVTAAQTTVVKEDYLFLMSAKISIPLTKLRYPSETELKEIQADFDKVTENVSSK